MTYRLIAGIALLSVAGVSQTADLNAVYGRIDAAARNFKGIAADVSNIEYTALVDDKNVETGTIKLLRAGDGTHMLVNLKGAGAGQIVSLDAHKGRVYNPVANIVDEWDITGKQATVNQWLLLGFGATSAELKANYEIAYGSAEKIGSQQTSRIVLVPKTADARKDLKQAELWIADNGPDSGLALQQKFLLPSGNYRLVTYSNMKPGAPPEKDLELKLAKGVQIQKH
jgi:hypothetical protein